MIVYDKNLQSEILLLFVCSLFSTPKCFENFVMNLKLSICLLNKAATIRIFWAHRHELLEKKLCQYQRPTEA